MRKSTRPTTSIARADRVGQYGGYVFSDPESAARHVQQRRLQARGGIAIGDQIFDIKAALDAGLFIAAALPTPPVRHRAKLNPADGRRPRCGFDAAASVSDLLREDGPDSGKARAPRQAAGADGAGALCICRRDRQLHDF